MSCEIRQGFKAGDLHSSLAYTPLTDGGSQINIAASGTHALTHKFSLPRSVVVGAGSVLKSCNFNYVLTSGTLTSTEGVIKKLTTQDATNISAAATVTSTDAGEVTAAATEMNKVVSTVTTPAYDNEAATHSVEYQYTITFVASTACVVKLYGGEVVYDLDTSGGSLTATAVTSAATLAAANYGLVTPCTVGAGDLAVTLPDPADNVPAFIHLKVTSGGGGNLVVDVAGGGNIIGVGDAAATDLTLTAPVAGDYVILASDSTSATGVWGVVSAKAGTVAIA